MAFGPQQVAQHAAAGERVLQMQLVDPAHQRQVRRRDGAWRVVRGRTGQPKEWALLDTGSSWVRSIIVLRSAGPPW